MTGECGGLPVRRVRTPPILHRNRSLAPLGEPVRPDVDRIGDECSDEIVPPEQIRGIHVELGPDVLSDRRSDPARPTHLPSARNRRRPS